MLFKPKFATILTLIVVSSCGDNFLQVEAVSQQQWDQLNSTVNGRLQAAIPFSRPCFPDVAQDVLGEFDEDECATVQAGYTNSTVRVGVVGSYMMTQWETCQATSEQCLLDDLDPSDAQAFSPPQVCAEGGIPPLYIDVQEPSDVQAAFSFSQNTSVPIVVKTTGHDYSGRSSGANALALWMYNLQQLSYNSTFVASGCQESSAAHGVTVGAGVTFGQLYDFAEANNITCPGAAELSVAVVGGHLQGGGHSALSNAFGLAVDRLLEVKIVTPTGEYLTANSCQNEDLFFAVRGGGGGTFGVVMEATIRALPQLSFPAVHFNFNVTSETERELLQFIASNSLQWAEAGWGGYILPKGSMLFVNPFLSMAQAEEQMASLQQFVTTNLGATFTLTLQPSFLTMFNNFLLPPALPVGLPFITTSRLIPAANFASNESQAELVDRVIEALDDSPYQIIFAVTPYYFKSPGGTSINPIWRESLWHVLGSASWNYNTTTDEKRAIYSNRTSQMDLLREITPGSGAYFAPSHNSQNEADVHEPDASASFWGDNYDTLVAIKRK
ncbi:hypothetical protein EVJ58_g8490 [Rhodofomes roseus]|uniref:FAD-binding PCMH-type domain-containing protein n=1 Tax=Rhodofomes roseus TaxID=34475 RepID=A0A4Y9XY70_9APHY|nr:hypothetical protein EVJ58_g8490 [Rhodofomes roseus]